MPLSDAIGEHWNKLKFMVMIGDGITNCILLPEDFTPFQLSVPIKHLYRRKKNTAKLLSNFREKLAQYIIKNAGFKHPYINYIVWDEAVCLEIYGNKNYDLIYVENTQEFDAGIKNILTHEGFDPEHDQIAILFKQDVKNDAVPTSETKDTSKPPVALKAAGPKELEHGSDTSLSKDQITVKPPAKVSAAIDEPEGLDQSTIMTPAKKVDSVPLDNTQKDSLPPTSNKSSGFSKGDYNSLPAGGKISGGTGGGHSRDLVTVDGAWATAESGGGRDELSGSIGGWDQFKANEKLVNVKVPPFDLDLHSTKLDKTQLGSRQVGEAEGMALEIELTLDNKAVTRIFGMKTSKEDPSFKPKLQAIYIGKGNASDNTDNLFRLILADGTKCIRGFLSKSNNRFVDNGSLQKNSIISLHKFVTRMDAGYMFGQRYILVYTLDIIESNPGKCIGEPSNINEFPVGGVPPSQRQQAGAEERQPTTVKSEAGNSRRKLHPPETKASEQKMELDQAIDEMKNNLSNSAILVGQIRRVPHSLRRIFGPEDGPSLLLLLQHHQATGKLALVLVLALKMHSTNLELQRQASLVVCRASIKVSSFQQSFLKQHGADMLVIALERLLEDSEVCHAIVSFFRLLADMKFETAKTIIGLRRLHGLNLEFRSPQENQHALLNRALFKAAGTILQALKMHSTSVKIQEDGFECLERTSYDVDKQGEIFVWDLPCDSINLVNTILRLHKMFANHAKINVDACSLLHNVLHRSRDTIGRTAALVDRTGQAEALIGLAEFTIRKHAGAEERILWGAFMVTCTVLSRYPHLAPGNMCALMSFWKEQPNNLLLATTGFALLAPIDLGASGMMDNPQGIIELVVNGAQLARKQEDPVMFEDCTFVLKELAKSTACRSAMTAVPKLVASITIAPQEDIGCSEEVSVHVICILSSLVREGGISAIMPDESPYCCVHGIINAMSSTPHYLFVQKAAFRLLSMVDFTKAAAKLAFTKAGGPCTVIASLSEHFWDEKLSENACKLMNMLTWSSNGLNMEPLLEGLLAADNAVVVILRPSKVP
ncbi:unknown protein [Seminavis robusta]|uniref:Replication factor-A protein 1 N-terminal domain-containing protein n=1 Tax=Seminavis robusta TaxID=568900 RepID=A0A9N8DH51_9STRA|nr:unknown protein [Seminavis robusta]|eukprot:Sro156_g070850.1 n/a (1052) ;mRNA; f:56968-60207